MNHAAEPQLPHPPAEQLQEALCEERVRLYRASAGASVAGQLLAAAALVFVLWDRSRPAALLAWLALMVMLLGTRLVTTRLESRSSADRRWRQLLPMRWTVVASGLGWAAAGWLPLAAGDAVALTFLTFMLAGVAAGALTFASYDFGAALLYAGATALALMARLIVSDAQVSLAVGLVVLVGLATLVGRRTQRNVVDTVKLRLAESSRVEQLLQAERQRERFSDEAASNAAALQVTLDSIDQGLLMLDAQGRTRFYNRRLVELAELPVSLLETHPTMREIADYQRSQGHFDQGQAEVMDAAARDDLDRWFAGEEVRFPASYLRRMPSGRTLQVNSRYLDDGSLVRTFSDVTAFVEVQAESRMLALVASHTDSAVLITDATRRIEWTNESFERATGWPLDLARGRRPRDLMGLQGADLAELARMDLELAAKGRSHGELEVRSRDGTARWIEIDMQAVPGPSGRIERCILVGRDVSVRRRAEQALREARDHAEQASRAKSEFLSSMSHELRTPLNAILGFSQLLERDLGSAEVERQRVYVGQVRRAGEHLLELINEVLDLGRIEAGKQSVSLEPVAMRPLFDECAHLMRTQAQARQVALDELLRGPADAAVVADRTRLRQVVLNLLSNAIKYNRPGGAVTAACVDEPEVWRFEVRDQGRGLDEGQRARLFSPFDRLGAEGGPIEGAGIGLVLCKRLVELMHGTIGVDSQPGRGSTFWVRLPRVQPRTPAAPADAATAVAAAEPAAAAAAGSCKVLYIEDNPVNVLLMESLLAAEPGAQLVTAQRPELGIELAQHERPHLILLDIQLPGIDGFEVLRRLRGIAALRAVEIHATSARVMPEDLARYAAAGFDGHLAKPLDLAALLTLVRRVKARATPPGPDSAAPADRLHA